MQALSKAQQKNAKIAVVNAYNKAPKNGDAVTRTLAMKRILIRVLYRLRPEKPD